MMTQRTWLGGFIASAEKILAAFLADGSPYKAELEEKGKLGGFLCIACPDGYPYLIASIGEPNQSNLDKYLEFCQEKARRLADNPDHNLSYESRDPDHSRWGGAVRGEDYLASFSGLPELLDEVLSALVLYDRSQLLLQELEERLSGNPRADAATLQFLIKALC